MRLNRRDFLASGSAAALTALFARDALAIGRSLPPVPSAEAMFGWASDVVAITEKHRQFRRSGSAGDAEVRRYIADRLASFGIPEVEDQRYRFEARWYESWSLSVGGEQVPCFFWRDSAFTKPGGLSAEVIHVGDRIPEDDSIRGKIVVVDVLPGEVSPRLLAAASDYVHDPAGAFTNAEPFAAPNVSPNFPLAFYAAHRRGAAALVGILSFPTGANQFYPDVGLAVRDRMPALMVGKLDGAKLVGRLRDAGGTLPGALTLRGQVEKKAESGNVVGTLPGRTEEVIVINTHHDGCFSSAVEDASGIACVLALAKFYGAYVPDLRIRTLVFDFEGNHWYWNYPFGSQKFFEQNPDVIDRTVATLGIEHIARHVVVEDGKYVDGGMPSPALLFAPASPELKQIGIEAVKKNDLAYTFVPRFAGEDLLIPAQTRWFHLAGIPVYQYITGPEYLYLADDTLDKIDKDRFVPVVKTFIDLVERLQYIPASRMRG